MKDKTTERLKTTARVRAYLARHAAGDPDASGLSLDDIAAGAKCSRTPLSDPDCPIMQQVREEIDAARRARSPAAIPPSASVASPAAPTLEVLREHARARTPSGTEHLTDADLAQRIRRAQQNAGRVMQQWLGHHGRGGSVDDAALARHDLEAALWALRRVADELGPLIEARNEREAQKTQAFVPAGAHVAQTSLGL